jgi:hypothetical protein
MPSAIGHIPVLPLDFHPRFADAKTVRVCVADASSALSNASPAIRKGLSEIAEYGIRALNATFCGG